MDGFEHAKPGSAESRIWHNQMKYDLTEFANEDQNTADANFWKNPRGVWYGTYERFKNLFEDRSDVCFIVSACFQKKVNTVVYSIIDVSV